MMGRLQPSFTRTAAHLPLQGPPWGMALKGLGRPTQRICPLPESADKGPGDICRREWVFLDYLLHIVGCSLCPQDSDLMKMQNTSQVALWTALSNVVSGWAEATLLALKREQRNTSPHWTLETQWTSKGRKRRGQMDVSDLLRTTAGTLRANVFKIFSISKTRHVCRAAHRLDIYADFYLWLSNLTFLRVSKDQLFVCCDISEYEQ